MARAVACLLLSLAILVYHSQGELTYYSASLDGYYNPDDVGSTDFWPGTSSELGEGNQGDEIYFGQLKVPYEQGKIMINSDDCPSCAKMVPGQHLCINFYWKLVKLGPTVGCAWTEPLAAHFMLSPEAIAAGWSKVNDETLEAPSGLLAAVEEWQENPKSKMSASIEGMFGRYLPWPQIASTSSTSQLIHREPNQLGEMYPIEGFSQLSMNDDCEGKFSGRYNPKYVQSFPGQKYKVHFYWQYMEVGPVVGTMFHHIDHIDLQSAYDLTYEAMELGWKYEKDLVQFTPPELLLNMANMIFEDRSRMQGTPLQWTMSAYGEGTSQAIHSPWPMGGAKTPESAENYPFYNYNIPHSDPNNSGGTIATTDRAVFDLHKIGQNMVKKVDIRFYRNLFQVGPLVGTYDTDEKTMEFTKMAITTGWWKQKTTSFNIFPPTKLYMGWMSQDNCGPRHTYAKCAKNEDEFPLELWPSGMRIFESDQERLCANIISTESERPDANDITTNDISTLRYTGGDGEHYFNLRKIIHKQADAGEGGQNPIPGHVRIPMNGVTNEFEILTCCYAAGAAHTKTCSRGATKTGATESCPAQQCISYSVLHGMYQIGLPFFESCASSRATNQHVNNIEESLNAFLGQTGQTALEAAAQTLEKATGFKNLEKLGKGIRQQIAEAANKPLLSAAYCDFYDKDCTEDSCEWVKCDYSLNDETLLKMDADNQAISVKKPTETDIKRREVYLLHNMIVAGPTVLVYGDGQNDISFPVLTMEAEAMGYVMEKPEDEETKILIPPYVKYQLEECDQAKNDSATTECDKNDFTQCYERVGGNPVLQA